MTTQVKRKRGRPKNRYATRQRSVMVPVTKMTEFDEYLVNLRQQALAEATANDRTTTKRA